MLNIESPTIFEKGISLSPKEKDLLQRKALSLNRLMALILKNRPDQGLNYGEMMLLIEGAYGQGKVNKDSVRRGLSEMTGSKGADESMRDKYGRWPLVKLDEKRLNPYVNPDKEKQIKIHLYAWNQGYREYPTYQEMYDKNAGKQMNFHEGLFE